MIHSTIGPRENVMAKKKRYVVEIEGQGMQVVLAENMKAARDYGKSCLPEVIVKRANQEAVDRYVKFRHCDKIREV